MIRKKSIVFSLLLLLSLSGFAQKYEKQADKAAKQIVDQKFRKLRKQFAPEVKERMSYFRILVLWKTIEAQAGKYVKIGERQFEDDGELEKYTYIATFEEAVLRIKLNYNHEGQIAGLFFVPLDYEAPDYASNLVYGKERLKVKTDTFEMGGELIIPEKCDQCPVVILVHGSGASDRDENIRPNKPFYDLAMGLAKHGVATIRYDKRNFVYKDHFANEQYDLYDETVDDAISAVQLVKNYPYLDTNRIWVLGHSLGGYAAPLIADNSPEVDGIVIFAGPTRPLNDLIVEQYYFLLGRDGKLSWIEKRVIKSQEKKSKKIANGNFDTTAATGKLMAYWPGAWWQGVREYDPVKTAQGLNTNILVMQGEEDFQVNAKGDYEGWTNGLKDKAHCVLYPGLSHLFTPGKKEDGPPQYLVPSNMPEEVIIDIANYVKQSAKK